VLADVVSLFDDYLITRSGTLYAFSKIFGVEFENTGVKSCIYDEWLTRMG